SKQRQSCFGRYKQMFLVAAWRAAGGRRAYSPDIASVLVPLCRSGAGCAVNARGGHMPRPLSGLLVVTLEQAVAAPYASCRLADAGARVIKLERAEGDFSRGYDRFAKGSSSYFVWLNRGKQSCRVDLRNPQDLALVQAMVAQADVFIQNLAPGATDRLGIGSEALRREHPRLITCDISGYGDAGPMRERKAYDLLVQAESGLAAITGTPDGPSRVGVSVCDIATGMHAYEAILEALIARSQT